MPLQSGTEAMSAQEEEMAIAILDIQGVPKK